MDRSIVYPGAIPLDGDLLHANQDAMKAIGFLIQSTLGTSTVVSGLACTPTTVPSMQVNVGPGLITSLSTVEPTAYGSLSADATNPLMKMGINYTTTLMSAMSAPASAGQSIVYLVQAAYSETDGTAIVLPYYNSTTPSAPYSGPSNTGVAQNTRRTQSVTLALKQGTAATTGSQTTPAPDSGYVGLYAITIANGQTTINAGNIATLATAPFIQFALPNLRPGFSVPLKFTSSSTWTAPAGVTQVKFRLGGGGGGGSGSPTSGTSWSGAGGGAGGYSEGVATVTPGTTYTLTVGAAGAGGAINSTGGTGGTTSFASFASATGGTGGVANGGGGVGGTGTGGTYNAQGGNGGDGSPSGSTIGIQGAVGFGAPGPFGGGGAPGVTGGGAAHAVSAGGGGAYQNAGYTGGVGGTGFIILEY